MTRKDFKVIAEAVASVDLSTRDRILLVEALVSALSQTNEHFDSDKFISACRRKI